MSDNGPIRVRLVLSGACHPAYSGRQLQLEVPLVQKNGAPTTTADLKSQIRKEWPSDLPEMQESINTVGMKILRTGNLLSDATKLQTILSATEARDCSVKTEAATRNGDEPRFLLMHLVFQRDSNLSKNDKDGSQTTASRRKETGRNDSCCCAAV